MERILQPSSLEELLSQPGNRGREFELTAISWNDQRTRLWVTPTSSTQLLIRTDVNQTETLFSTLFRYRGQWSGHRFIVHNPETYTVAEFDQFCYPPGHHLCDETFGLGDFRPGGRGLPIYGSAFRGIRVVSELDRPEIATIWCRENGDGHLELWKQNLDSSG